jgi:hypothetical protein
MDLAGKKSIHVGTNSPLSPGLLVVLVRVVESAAYLSIFVVEENEERAR